MQQEQQTIVTQGLPVEALAFLRHCGCELTYSEKTVTIQYPPQTQVSFERYRINTRFCRVEFPCGLQVETASDVASPFTRVLIDPRDLLGFLHHFPEKVREERAYNEQ
ncbi:hypothetical protein EI42_05726 [Thermosporothrix hazakensis]|jgi:hypothetical protein|uniref:Uncharacterized protein n=2 Tax=Thermosporothrix TaxID=768650 RepID=A0A326TVH3_THEHA|nr:hypothetical protein [Thermosporothrix hazakensis]PZW21071.1 hypothetical protein EI42_05726 [Thermosporothrix hazakensis]BBH88203.1 hypothetical protein KTC_29540 [Thermosporothrix sp. COM3]GCE46391.1 hypothetical protein KTH_12600 [Thermosporothrix hazakensis]